jgi:SAM-dependent methyltransferase
MPDWNQLFDNPHNILRQVDPLAAELSRTLRRGARVLDLGCGGGRHLIALAEAGHRVTGMDIAPRGLEHCREWLAAVDLEAELVLGDFRRPLPFEDSSFDAVLSIKVINHGTPEDIHQVFGEVTRITRPGGRFVGSVISSEDARYGDGEQIAEHTFVHDRPPEDGVPHHYFTEASLRGHLRGFTTVDLSLIERVVSPEEPVFGQYRFREGVAPVLRHWNFKTLK